MKKFYTISEIAEFFNISRQTLIYYDKINIFKPAFIDENGYRYYSRDQFSELSFIISLKNSGFSLNNIKEYFKSRNPEESLSFLEEKILDIERKISELSKSKEAVEKKILELNKILKNNDSIPKIKKLDAIKIIPVEVKFPYDTFEYEIAAKELNKIVKKLPFETMQFFSAVFKENIGYNTSLEINYIGAVVPMDFNYPDTKILEGGTFVSMKHTDIYDNIKFTYKKLLDFIKENNFEIKGDSREISSDAILFLGKGAGSYMEIQIPVVSKKEKEN